MWLLILWLSLPREHLHVAVPVDPIYEYIQEEVDKYPKSFITADIVMQVIKKESNFNDKAKGSLDEIGLMQVRPMHCKELGIKKEQLWNPETNIKAGVYILMKYAKGSKNVMETLAKYNAGPSNIKAGMEYAAAVLGMGI